MTAADGLGGTGAVAERPIADIGGQAAGRKALRGWLRVVPARTSSQQRCRGRPKSVHVDNGRHRPNLWRIRASAGQKRHNLSRRTNFQRLRPDVFRIRFENWPGVGYAWGHLDRMLAELGQSSGNPTTFRQRSPNSRRCLIEVGPNPTTSGRFSQHTMQ